MYKGVKAVSPLPDYELLLTFEDNEQRVFDMKPYLQHGIFAELQDQAIFRSVHVCFDTVEWNNGADLCPEILYSNSTEFSHDNERRDIEDYTEVRKALFHGQTVTDIVNDMEQPQR
jgi:hypothetical protein